MADIKQIEVNNTTYNLRDSNAITTGNENQSKTGNLSLYGQTVLGGYTLFGDATLRRQTAGADYAPQYTRFANQNSRNSALTGVKILTGSVDHLYCCDLMTDYTITSTYKGTGLNDVYSETGYSIVNGVVGDGASSLRNLFDGKYDSNIFIPTAELSTKPWVLTILKTSMIEYTDVISLTLYQHRLNNAGHLRRYTLEVYNTATNAWTTVYNRSGVSDEINGATFCLSNAPSYIGIRGIRLTVYECDPTSSYSANTLNIANVEIRNDRPSFDAPSGIGALPLRGGTVYGQTNFSNIKPRTTEVYDLGDTSHQWKTIWGKAIYENGTTLSSKYLGIQSKAANADKLDGLDSTYYLNYNNLTNKPTIPTDTNQKVKAGTVTFGNNDEVNIVAGSNVTVTGDATNKKITIAATDTTYESKAAASGGTDVSLVTTGEKYTWNNKGTYSKPSGGIPKTDLASAVQTSLGKADTALQSFTETDPTVPSWAKSSTKPTYTASEVGARPSTWTPSKSDIGLGNVGNFKAVSTVASQGLTDTEKSNARANIGAGTSNFSGSYNDLTDKPTIPSVGNGRVTINQGGVQKGTFTLNQTGDATINLDAGGSDGQPQIVFHFLGENE